MQTISASELKQNSVRLQDALRDDLLVTKRDKPFVVVMDYEKYVKLQAYIDKLESERTEDDGYPSISFDEACGRVAEAVEEYRKNGTDNTIPFDETYLQKLNQIIDNA